MKVQVAKETVDVLKSRGGTWGVYENQAFDSASAGHIKFLRVGEGCTYAEPPPKLPDTDSAINWRYILVGIVEAAKLPDDGIVEL